MQIWRILRGCLAAYVLGVVMMWSSGALDGALGLRDLAAFLIFGLFFGIPVTFVCLLVWMWLGAQAVVLPWWVAPVVGGGLGLGMVVGIAFSGPVEGGLLRAALIVPLGGIAMGLAAWVGAFGFAARMPMARRMPRP